MLEFGTMFWERRDPLQFFFIFFKVAHNKRKIQCFSSSHMSPKAKNEETLEMGPHPKMG